MRGMIKKEGKKENKRDWTWLTEEGQKRFSENVKISYSLLDTPRFSKSSLHYVMDRTDFQCRYISKRAC